MKIKNKYSKQKIDKKNIRLNKLIKYKGSIRLKLKKIKPLNEREKFLYTDDWMLKDETPKKENDKYLLLNNIILVNFVSKVNCQELYNGIIKLYGKNPPKDYLGEEIRPNDLKRYILDFSNSCNNERWCKVCSISPSNKELHKISNYILISIFEASNDLIGISFNIFLTDSSRKMLEDILSQDVGAKKIYSKYKIKNRKRISVSYTSGSSIRSNNFEDMLLEIKSRFNQIFIKYLPLEIEYLYKSPISLDIYQTNYNVKDNYLLSTGLINHSIEEKANVGVCLRNHKENYINTTMWYSITVTYYQINRSNNVFVYVNKRSDKIIFEGHKFINLLLLTLTFYQVEEMIKEISVERNRLFKLSSNKAKKNYKQYVKLNECMQKYRMIFNGLKCYYPNNSDDYEINGFDNLYKKYNDYYKQYEELNKEYSFRMNINNSISAFSFSKFSIIVAIVAILLTIYFECKSDTNNNKCQENENIVTTLELKSQEKK